MPSIAYVTNAPPQSGMGKPAREIAHILRAGNRELTFDIFEMDAGARTLRKNGGQVAAVSALPGPLNVKPAAWWRLARHLPSDGYDLWHLTNQTLSFIPRSPAVVTVYDLIEALEPQERFGRPVAKFLYRGIPKASHLICISEYTKKTVQEIYGIPDERITVIPLGVGENLRAVEGVRNSLDFHEFLRTQRIEPETQIVLYVGSDHPRKNLTVLAEAFARVHREQPKTILLKVGDPGLAEGREKFLADLDRLGIRDAVRFIPNVGDDQLRFFYSVADVFVFPSTFEGFGIPPLEAMACGCPVVCSNATSLPEVVGDAGILCDPKDVDQFAKAILEILTNPETAARLRNMGPQRAQLFGWKRITEKTLEVYKKVLG